MTCVYSPAEGNYVKSRREKEHPGIELARCADNLWRTPDEKAAFDEHAAIASEQFAKLAR